MASPVQQKKIIKKRVHKFIRFQSDRFKRVAEAWRKPRGIDNRMRRRFSGNRPMPRIGFGTDRATKHHMKNGFKKFVVHNVKELEILLMQNRVFAAEIGHAVSARKRILILNRAKQLDVRVMNAHARVEVAAA